MRQGLGLVGHGHSGCQGPNRICKGSCGIRRSNAIGFFAAVRSGLSGKTVRQSFLTQVLSSLFEFVVEISLDQDASALSLHDHLLAILNRLPGGSPCDQQHEDFADPSHWQNSSCHTNREACSCQVSSVSDRGTERRKELENAVIML